MNKTLENKLFQEHFAVLNKNDFPSGLPVDDGWFVIIDTICYHIKDRINIIHWGYNHTEDGKMECKVSISKMLRQEWGGRLTLEFDVEWVGANPNEKVENDLQSRLKELKNLVETWSSRTCEISGRPGKQCVSINDNKITRILDVNVAKALDFVNVD